MAKNVTFDDTGAHAPWAVRENCTWSREFTARADGVAVNLASYTITAEITADEVTDAASKSFTVTKTDAASGKFKIVVAAADATLTPGRYWWSMQWNDGTNDVPLCSGPFVVHQWTL
jgi:hypothetical protein